MRIKVHNPDKLPLIDYRDLKPLQGDLKILTPENYEKLKQSFISKGFIVPFFVWNPPGTPLMYALDGHQRLTVLNGENVTPYKLPRVLIEASDIKEAKEMLLVITSQYGTITSEGLQEFTKDISLEFISQAVTFDLLPDFFNDVATGAGGAREDMYEPPDEIRGTDIVPGDLFEMGPHRLLCGDARSGDHLGRLMAGKKFDLVILDPDRQENPGTDKALDDEYYQFILSAFTAAHNYTRPGGAWYVWHHETDGLIIRTAFQEAGMMMKQTLICVNNSITLGRQDYQVKHDPCLYGWKPGAAHYFTDQRTSPTVIDDKIDYSKMKKQDLLDLVLEIMGGNTPTTVTYQNKAARNKLGVRSKPVLLFADHIQNSTRPGDIVGDLFAGMGTSFVGSHQLKRICYGMELAPYRCHAIIDRMRKLDQTIDITRNGKPYTI